MDLDMNPIVRVSDKLRRQLGPPIQGKHLLNLEPTHPNTLHRQTESLTTRSQRHLSKSRRGHHRLAMHLMIRQPGDQLGVHLRPPHMITARRYLNMHPKQRVSTGRPDPDRSIRHPVPRMQPRSRRNIHQPTCAALGRRHTERGEL